MSHFLHEIDPTLDALGRALPERIRAFGEAWHNPVNCPELHTLAAADGWSGLSWLFQHSIEGATISLRQQTRHVLAGAAMRLSERDDFFEVVFPDFGFGDGGKISIDYGVRGTLELRLDQNCSVIAFDGDRKLASLPQPRVADDPEEIARIRSAVSRLKKEIRRALKLAQLRMGQLQKHPFEIGGRVFREAAANPFWRDAARHVLWGVSTPSRLAGVFALDSCGDAVDLDDEPLEIPDDAVVRGLFRGFLTEDERLRWSHWFAENGCHCEQLVPWRRAELRGIDSRDIFKREMPSAAKKVFAKRLLELGWHECPPNDVSMENDSLPPSMMKEFGSHGIFASICGHTSAPAEFRHLNFGTDPGAWYVEPFPWDLDEDHPDYYDPVEGIDEDELDDAAWFDRWVDDEGWSEYRIRDEHGNDVLRCHRRYLQVREVPLAVRTEAFHDVSHACRMAARVLAKTRISPSRQAREHRSGWRIADLFPPY